MIDVWACCTWFTPIYTYMISPIIKHTTATAQGGYLGRITCENCDFWHHGFIFHKICYILALIVFSSWIHPGVGLRTWDWLVRFIRHELVSSICIYPMRMIHFSIYITHGVISGSFTWNPHTGKNHGKISWKCCMFPKKNPFFSQNGRIFRPAWEKNGTISQNFLAIFPVQCNIAVVYLEETWSNFISITCCNICGKSMK